MLKNPGIKALLVMAVLYQLPAVAVTCETLSERAGTIRELRDRDPDAGVAQARELLDRSDEVGLDCPAGRMQVHAALASNLHILGRSEAAIEAVQAALALSEDVDDPDRLAAVQRTAGVVYWSIGEHDRALRHYLAALEGSREAGDVAGAARAAGNIGNLHNSMGNFEQARRYHLEALDGFEQMGWDEGVAGTLVNLGALAARVAESLEEDGESQAAREEHRANLDYNRRALELFEQLGNPRGIAYAADNMARALIHLDRVEEALDLHRRSLDLRREVGDTAGVVNSLLTGADAHMRLGDFDEARALLEEADELVPESSRDLARQIVEFRTRLFERMGDYRAAFESQQQLMAISDAESSAAMAARVEQLEQRYRAEQLKKELALERARAEVSQQRARRQQIISTFSIVAVVLLLLILALLYNRYRLGRAVSRSLDVAARTDPLTGLANRREMAERIEAAVDRRQRADEPASLIMADVDSFKRVNDSLGHQVGDEVLQHIADLLRSNVRGQDVASRWGGEEFLILLPATDEPGARSVSENIRQALSESPPQVGERPLACSMTFGVAELAPGETFDELLARVDEALYAGKARGKDRVVAASEAQA